MLFASVRLGTPVGVLVIVILKHCYVHIFFTHFCFVPAALVARGFTFMGGDCLPKPTLLCEDVDTVSCSGCLTAVQKIDGSVLCYGYNSYGQCGVDPEHEDAKIGKETVDYLNPITALPPSHMIDTGLQHVISLSQSGKVYTWGKGGNGQLGNSEVLFSFTPVHVDIVNKCRKVAAGFAHSAAICEEGKFYIWGKGVSDLKFGEKEQAKFSVLRYQDKLVPRVLSLPGKRKAIDIATSFYSTIVVADDLSVWAMGLGEFDRKPLCNLTQVENEVGTKGFLRLHPGYRLAKGGKRVIIFDSAPGAEPIDIILHEEDAYTKKTSIHFEDGAQIFSSNVLSMCGSLHHSLAVAIK